MLTTPVAVVLLLLLCGMASCSDNGLARTPPMGWSSWNHYHRNISGELFRSTADAMVASGMHGAGYEYVNIDGGWWAGSDTGHVVRNSSGYMAYNKAKFPEGLPTVIAYIHSKGLKYGHYTDAGKHACNGDRPMSQGYEHQDATLFAEWEIDMIKVDACGTTLPAETLMKQWSDELGKVNRSILLSNCHNGCLTSSYHPWCPRLANMWRSSKDIRATWSSMLSNLDTLKGRGKFGAPGGWNDPDILEAIAINQQYLDNAGDVLHEFPHHQTEVWYKPLPNTTAAVALFNRGGVAPQNISVSFADLPVLRGHTLCSVHSVWDNTTATHSGAYTVVVSPHQVVLLQIQPTAPHSLPGLPGT